MMMNNIHSQHVSLPYPGKAVRAWKSFNAMSAGPLELSRASSTGEGEGVQRKTTFSWHDRFVEGGLILSMALYYIVGNPNLDSGYLARLNPLFSLPFLLIFAALCWYRLPTALALLPLSLPFYLAQKVVFAHYEFSLAEVSLAICTLVALVQLVLRRDAWLSKLSWSELATRVGPFLWPVLLFLLAAAFSIVVAYSRGTAMRTFRQEVFDPLLFMGLALIFLRSRADVHRLLGALMATGGFIALLGIVQYVFFKETLVLEPDGIRRVHTVYGSANSIGLLFDYVLPLALALLFARVSWKLRGMALLLCLPMLFVLYLSQSRGAWLAIACAALFIIIFAIRNRKVLIVGALVALVALSLALGIFHTRIFASIFDSHTDQQGVSTVTKRVYLWQSAWRLILDYPLTGVGMDNWLCYYSLNNICDAHARHYWLTRDPITKASTGLREEPTLSHPHNIFLHVWVSIGLFGLLAFVAVLVLFYLLFAALLRYLRSGPVSGAEDLRWMIVGLGAAMLAACLQGMVDSAFLEQDLAFCFWMLVTGLLLVRSLAGTPWNLLLRPSRVSE